MRGESQQRATTLLLLLALSLLFGYLVYREHQRKRPDQVVFTTAGYVDMCLACHTTEKLDPAHDSQLLGCALCHRGDRFTGDKEKAHRDMVLNPGELRVAATTCGISACHPAELQKVENSLMATNRGILATLLYYWGEAEHQYGKLSVRQLEESKENSPARDYYRKLCASCHLGKSKNDLPQGPKFYNDKGGGCSACHSVAPPIPAKKSEARGDMSGQPLQPVKIHPLISKKVPEEKCIRCHNRSGRIGLSYTGRLEAEGYGTPYEQGRLSAKQLPGGAFYLELAEDAHHKKGMVCIDCHTREEIMGDGNNYAHYEDQLEISCESCHTARPGMTRKERALRNIAEEHGAFVLTGKLDGVKRPLKPPRHDSCGYPGHKRLTCEACHSTWVPQCYGCHINRDNRETQLDKLSLRKTRGWWQEGRSYMRYEKPMLALWGNEIVIVTPGCQDIVTLLDEQGAVEKGFNRFTMAAIAPHTTQRAGRSCAECHTSSKTVGLGEGTVWSTDGVWRFTPVDQGLATWNGTTAGLDRFVTIDGQPLQHGSRPDLRPFNGEELRRILRVGLCLECHKEYGDAAFRDYDFQRPCPIYVEP